MQNIMHKYPFVVKHSSLIRCRKISSKPIERHIHAHLSHSTRKKNNDMKMNDTKLRANS